MPANKKHLTKSPWLRLLKILVGTIGGYAVMFTFHLMLCKVFPPENVMVTSFITGYLLWAILLLVAFLDKNVFKIGGVYLLLSLVCSGIYFIA